MDLVDDQEVEAVPEVGHVPIRALEGGHRQRVELAHAVAIAPDGAAMQPVDLPQPLIEQDTSRDQTQGAQTCPLHGGKREPRLAAPGRKGDDPSAVPEFPGGQGCLLIRSEVDGRPRFPGRPERRRDVLEPDPALDEPSLERAIPDGGRAMHANSGVPYDTRRRGEVAIIGRVRQQDGAPVES